MNLIPHTFDGTTIQQRAADGYLNATAMCQSVGKRFNDYKAPEPHKAFLAALSASTILTVDELIQSHSGPPSTGGGSWVHPQVAIHLAMWLKPEFAVQVTGWVQEWLTQGKVTINPEPAAPTQPNQNDRLLQYLEQDRLERIVREDRLFALLGAPRRGPEARSTEAHAPQSWSVTETAAELTMTAQKLYKELRRLRWIDGKPDAWGPIREEGKPYLTWAARTKPHHNDQIRINAAGKVELKREFREPRAAINNYFASTGKPH